MGMTLITRRFGAWIACFAILLSALAPSISQAVASAKQESSSGWVEICSMAGIRFVQVDGDKSGIGQPDGKVMQMAHCAFCSMHAGSVGLPPTSFALPLPVEVATVMQPTLYYQSPSPLFVWSTAQSRAPPGLV